VEIRISASFSRILVDFRLGRPEATDRRDGRIAALPKGTVSGAMAQKSRPPLRGQPRLAAPSPFFRPHGPEMLAEAREDQHRFPGAGAEMPEKFPVLSRNSGAELPKPCGAASAGRGARLQAPCLEHDRPRRTCCW